MLTSMLLGHDRKNTFLNVDKSCARSQPNHVRSFFIQWAADGSDRPTCMRKGHLRGMECPGHDPGNISSNPS